MSQPHSQALSMLRSIRKALRRSPPEYPREGLWMLWYAQLDHARDLGLLSDKAHGWLGIREHVFAKSWGLPLRKGSTCFFSDARLDGCWDGKPHTRQRAYERQWRALG